jgi:hypothetical protein
LGKGKPIDGWQLQVAGSILNIYHQIEFFAIDDFSLDYSNDPLKPTRGPFPQHQPMAGAEDSDDLLINITGFSSLLDRYKTPA